MDITVDDTPIPNAMELYYDWLLDLIGPKGDDKIALLGTITTFDIQGDAPLYTNQIFRQFADRTITVSPTDFGKGNDYDRFSAVYDEIVQTAASQLYAEQELSDQAVLQLQRYDGEITEAVDEIKDVRFLTNAQWMEFAEAAKLEPKTPDYDLEKAKFYQPSISQILNQRQKITRAQAKRRAIWLNAFAGDPDARRLAIVYENCISAKNQQALPQDPETEITYGLDPIKIGAAADSGIYAFDVSLGINPSGSLTKVLDLSGPRTVTIKKGDTHIHNHDKKWSASASGGWGFWKARGSVTQEEHLRQTLTKLEDITITCDYIGDYWVSRRNWFSSTILGNKYVKEILDDDPASATLLSNVISSVVIARGLKVIYNFSDTNDTKVWSSIVSSASGGFSVFGIGASIGGSYSEAEMTHDITEDGKGIIFSDDEQTCRLLALRVSPLLSLDEELVAAFNNALGDTLLGSRMILDAWDGNIKSLEISEQFERGMPVKKSE